MRRRSLLLLTAVLAAVALVPAAGAQQLAPVAVVHVDTLASTPHHSVGARVVMHGLKGAAIGAGVGLVVGLVGARSETSSELKGIWYMAGTIYGAGLGLVAGAIQGALTAR